MSRRAFTLLELLTVISIIAALAALLIPVIGIARKAARNAQASSQMGQIQAALAGYKDANGIYPESYIPSAGATDIYATTLATGSGTSAVPIPASSPITENAWRALSQALKVQLQTVDPDNFNINTSNGDPRAPYIVDPYGTRQLFCVWRYRPARYYPFAAATSTVPVTIDGPNPPNPNSYQLWSCGWDGKDEFGMQLLTLNGVTIKGDDVPNWQNK
jgi:prepilin-type N-terminal cleavage/methylation domain-containing protein